MNFRWSIILWVGLYCSSSLPAQDSTNKKVDSLLLSLNSATDDSTRYAIYGNLFRQYYRSDLKKAKEYLEKEIESAAKTSKEHIIHAAKNHEAIYYGISGETQKSLEVFTELKAYYSQKGNKEKVASVLLNISSTNQRLGRFTEALETQMESLALVEALGKTGKTLGNCYFSIGNIHRLMENTKVSQEWMFKALEVYKKADLPEYQAQSSYTIGINYIALDSMALAEQYLDYSVDYFRSTKNKRSLSTALIGLGKSKLKLGEIDGALLCFEEAKELTELSGDIVSQMEILSSMGTIHHINQDYPLAITSKLASLEIARKISNRKVEVELLDELALLYGKNRQYSKAFELRESYTTLHDSIVKEDNLASISELELAYQTEKKEQEIILLEEKAKRNSLEKKAMLTSICLLLLLLSAIIYAMKQKLKNNTIAKEKVDQELEYSNKELNLKKQELSAYALQLAHNNEVLQGIKSNVENLKEQSPDTLAVQKIINTISINQSNEETWEEFRTRFLAVHKNFEKNVKNLFPQVSKNELRLMALLKMNLSNKEIANILNISSAGIKKARYRLRKKLALNTADSLEELVIEL